MRRDERPFARRTTAQLLIIVGSMILFVGMILLTISFAIGDPNAANRRGVPLWLSTSIVLFIGALMMTVGALVYPRSGSRTSPE